MADKEVLDAKFNKKMYKSVDPKNGFNVRFFY